MAQTQTILIGIDGGGTGCRLGVECSGQRHLVETGPTNVTTNFAQSVETLTAGLSTLADIAGLSMSDLQGGHAHLGVAGILSRDDAARLGAALPLKRAVITDDQITTLRGALGRDDGIVLSLGTGSFAARQTRGDVRTIGGWGLILGDEASGAWLGREAIATALRAKDGLETGSPFLKSLAPRLMDFVGTPKQADFAALAPDVIAAALQEDPKAKAILDQALAYLERVVSTLDPQANLPLCLIGGLARSYRDLLPDALSKRLVPARGTALDGAFDLAREAALS